MKKLVIVLVALAVLLLISGTASANPPGTYVVQSSGNVVFVRSQTGFVASDGCGFGGASQLPAYGFDGGGFGGGFVGGFSRSAVVVGGGFGGGFEGGFFGCASNRVFVGGSRAAFVGERGIGVRRRGVIVR